MIVPNSKEFADVVLKETTAALLGAENDFNKLFEDILSSEEQDEFKLLVKLISKFQILETAILMAMPFETPQKSHEFLTLVRQQIILSKLSLGILSREDVLAFYPDLPLDAVDRISPIDEAAVELKKALEKVEEARES